MTQVYINFLAHFHWSKIGRHTKLRFVGVRNRDLVFASSCSPEFEGVFPAARNYRVLPVGILCASFYLSKSRMLLIVLSRVLV